MVTVPNIQIPETFEYQTILSPVFKRLVSRCLSNTRQLFKWYPKFAILTTFYHLKTGHIQYSDPTLFLTHIQGKNKISSK